MLRSLQYFFGRKWPLVILAILGCSLAPAFLFYGSISFDPAAFTQEWIKVMTTGIVFYLVAAVLTEKFQISKSRARFTGATQELIHVVERLRVHLADMLANLERRDDAAVRNHGQCVWSDWLSLKANLSGMREANFEHIMGITEIHTAFNEINVDKIQAVLQLAAFAPQVPLDRTELLEIAESLVTLSEKLKKVG